jgi:BASS family bile acid:Na+ symporter
MSAAALLALAGRRGPVLLFGGVLAGLGWPALAAAVRPLMDAAVFCFTLGAFLKVDLPAFRSEAGRAHAIRNAAVLSRASLGVPLVAWVAILVLSPGPELAEGLLLCTPAPPVGSAAALAAMLGLNAPVALLASVAATAVSPLVMPALAELLGGYALALDPMAMAQRLAVIVGGAAAASWLLRRWAGGFVAANPLAIPGLRWSRWWSSRLAPCMACARSSRPIRAWWRCISAWPLRRMRVSSCSARRSSRGRGSTARRQSG